MDNGAVPTHSNKGGEVEIRLKNLRGSHGIPAAEIACSSVTYCHILTLRSVLKLHATPALHANYTCTFIFLSLKHGKQEYMEINKYELKILKSIFLSNS